MIRLTILKQKLMRSVITVALVMACAMAWAQSTNFTDDGNDTYTIHNATGWEEFCDALQNDTNNSTYNRFSGKTVKLGTDISVICMAGGQYHDFCGTFDGQGHTLTFNYGEADKYSTESYVAPFRNVESGCIIENLHVAGDIYTTGKYAAGIVCSQYGEVIIRNCRSSINIHSGCSGDGTHGGLVANNNKHAHLTIEGCVFDGKLLTTNGTSYCGGFVGWRASEVTITNCLYAPAALEEGETWVGTTGSATFARNGGTFTNCYYTTDFNNGTLYTRQGKQLRSIAPGAGVTLTFNGTDTLNNVSNITTYTLSDPSTSSGQALNPGLKYGDTYYSGADNQVSLILGTQTSYTFDGYNATAGTLAGNENPYTLTMPDGDVTIYGTGCPMPTSVIVSDITANGATVIWTSNASAWQICLNNDEAHLIDVNETTTYSFTNLSPNTPYTVQVRTNCGGNTVSGWSSPISFITGGLAYCIPSFGKANDDHINSFETTGGINNISNTSSSFNSDGYQDFYDTHSASITAGQTLSFTVTPSSTTWSYGHAIWVDWNNDYIFSSDEKVAYKTTPVAGIWTRSITVPTSTPAGDHRMRVIQLYNSTDLEPCLSVTYGEAEDYKLTVLSAGEYTITCATPTHGTLSADRNYADENVVVTITATPEPDYLLTELTYTPEGGSAQSINIASMPYTFNMPAANVTVNATFTATSCVRPTDVAVDRVTHNAAKISWTNENDDYQLQYAKLGFIYTFDHGTLDGWTNLKVNSDGGEWINSAINAGDYDYSTNAHSGESYALSYSFVDHGGSYNTDVYLVSPQRYEITSESASLHFFYAWANSTYPDYLEVCVSTAEPHTASDFTSLGWHVGDPGDSKNSEDRHGKTRDEWNEVTLQLGSYKDQSIWIAFRHIANNQYKIWLDDVTVTPAGIIWSTTPDPIASPYLLEDLESESLYAVQVKTICHDPEGESSWSDAVSFMTSTPCAIPYHLHVTDITTNSATLNWTGNQNSFNVTYKKQYFYDNFDDNDVSDWTRNDGRVYNWNSLTDYFVILGYTSLETQYLISPDLSDMAGGNVLEFSQHYYQAPMTFYVGYSSTTSDIDDFTWGSEIYASDVATSHIETIPTGTKYIAIKTTATH